MSSQRSREHVTHESMAKVHQARWGDLDKGISDRGDIGAAKQARGKQAYLKGIATAGDSIIVGAAGEKRIIVVKG